jgi:hypothetical protein
MFLFLFYASVSAEIKLRRLGSEGHVTYRMSKKNFTLSK